MQGDFSVLNFDPHLHERALERPADGVLRNLSAVLHQQGRVSTDRDFTEGELQELAWNGQAGRDIIGAGVCAVPAAEPEGFRVESAAVVGDGVRVRLRPGRAWADGILTRLAGEAPDPQAPVERLATYYGPPLAASVPTPDQIDDGVRDAVVLEVSEESVHGFQYPERLIEPALGGPDTSERAFVNFRIRLLRLAPGEDCASIAGRLRDDPSSKGRLGVSLAPVVAIAGDCPVVGGGGYTGFEHCLYRIEIADTPPDAPARFKWSQWNGGLVGRGRFDATTDPDRVVLDAGRAAIVNSGLTEFYLEALQYDPLVGAWQVVYGTTATLNTDHDLELASPPAFGTLPASAEPVFLRLWNGIADIAAFTDAANPVELRDGIRLVFDPPAAGNYAAGDYWTFTVRAGGIANDAILIDDAPPVGIVRHRVPLAEINWTGRRNTDISGTIEDCRKRFRPLVNQRTCCTFLVGDGVSSFGDFNALEVAAAHLPAAGGELCLLPGVHRANLRLEGRRNVKIHGCRWRTLVLPRTETRAQPILHFVDCSGIEVCDLDLATYDGIAVRMDGSTEDACRDLRIHDTRMIARTNAIRATNAADLVIANNRLHLLDTVEGRATVSLAADDVRCERNELVLLPFAERPPEEPDRPEEDPGTDPADPCARPEIIYRHPRFVLQYVAAVWQFPLAQLAPRQPYRALGGIHVRAGSERVRILENRIAGGGGNGITLGGDLEAEPGQPVPEPGQPEIGRSRDPAAMAKVNVTANGQFLALVQDAQGTPVPDLDLYLEADAVSADRTDARGMAAVKAAPGSYTLDVGPRYRVLRVTEARDQGVLVNAVTVGPRERVAVRGFLHEVTIEDNDIGMMGLSGIGFAVRAGTSVRGPARAIPANDPRGAVLAYIDAFLLTLALTPLLRATDPVRDLVVRANRIHHNLRNPFSEAMLEEAQFIGRGGISLAIVEVAVLNGNHVYENGPRAVDPTCGIFVGYGDNVEISDNVLAANGTTTADFERNRRAGIRGGVYVRFAGAITTRLSTSSGRNAALRVHDNRIDQPAGRALTAIAFGPVSVANNHLNSELTGLLGFFDTVVGGALVVNFGGIHRLLARQYKDYLGGRFDMVAAHAYGLAAERALPGGETLFDDNYVRLGLGNRSIVSQMLLALDDLGYASNTASVYRGDPFFANALLLADSVRATSSRLREDATRTLSALTFGLRMNMTAMNQADHCVIALPAAGTGVLPTVDAPNQVLDFIQCARLFPQASGIGRYLVSVLAAHSDQLGGTLPDDAFALGDVVAIAQSSAAAAIGAINATQLATTRAYQYEAARMAAKRGDDHPVVVALRAQGEAGAQTNRVLAQAAETVVVREPETSKEGSSLSGRFVNDRGQGLADYTIELVRANGTPLEAIGRTDASGFFSATYDERRTAALHKEGELFARALDLAGKEVLRDKTALAFAPGAAFRLLLTVPVPVVPKSVAIDGAVIYDRGGGTPPAPQDPSTPPGPGTPPTPPQPSQPEPSQPEPPAPTVRTPLERLDIEEEARKRLRAAGIRDVEDVVEAGPEKLGAILDDRALGERIVAMAKTLLEGTDPNAPGGTRPRTRKTPAKRRNG